MPADTDVEVEEDPELGNGDLLSERLDELELDLDETESTSTDEMRERLGL